MHDARLELSPKASFCNTTCNCLGNTGEKSPTIHLKKSDATASSASTVEFYLKRCWTRLRARCWTTRLRASSLDMFPQKRWYCDSVASAFVANVPFCHRKKILVRLHRQELFSFETIVYDEHPENWSIPDQIMGIHFP